ncbi:autophagy-related protein 16 [Scheffersomyces xylosifermentans]|uniref:autophagy-related protein 16 n=1 Tax=Scheffersomyces xylosifermentans TaxID=1304137 RepID=UPI00315D7A8A
MTSWRDDILQKLEVRDQLERQDSPYFEAFAQLTQQLQTQKLIAEQSKSSSSPSPSPSLTTESPKQKHKDLKHVTLVNAQLESSIIQRENQQLELENSDLIGSLNQSAINLEKLEAALAAEKKSKKDLEAKVNRLSTRIETLGLQLKEKNKSIEIINEEILSGKIQNNVLQSKVEELTKQNEELINRWMERAKTDAEKMNDANAFLESISREKSQ